VDRRPPLATVASGLVIVAIGYGCGAPPAEPPVEKHNSTAERHEPHLTERGAKAQAAHTRARDAASVQYWDSPPAEYPRHAASGFDQTERETVGSAPVATGGDRTVELPIMHSGSPPVMGQVAPTGSSSPTDLEPISAAIIRAYFARRFLYKTWYLHVRDIDVHGRFASIIAWHLNESSAPKQARNICNAALSLQRLRGASVRFSSNDQPLRCIGP
jgi:hypothetical protein